jgi:hypothetical protein
MKMNFGYEEGNMPVGGVQFFPDSAQFWDPAGLAEDDSKLFQYQVAEIKHGRVAMLGALHYIITDALGVRLPGDLGGVAFNDIPATLGAIKAVPAAGWAQILIFASALEVLAPQKEDKVAGNCQPDTAAFKVPGDVEIRTKEINNGRLAMVSMLGIWVGEALSGGQEPFDLFLSKIGY